MVTTGASSYQWHRNGQNVAGASGACYANGPASQARFRGAVALAFDGSGDLYVADYNAIRRIAPDGAVSTIAGSPRDCGSAAGIGAAALLYYPTSLTTDMAGNVYAGDFNGAVWQIAPAGVESTLAGFAGITVDSIGMLYVTSYNDALEL